MLRSAYVVVVRTPSKVNREWMTVSCLWDCRVNQQQTHLHTVKSRLHGSTAAMWRKALHAEKTRNQNISTYRVELENGSREPYRISYIVRLLWSFTVANLKFLCSPYMTTRKATLSAWGDFGGYGSLKEPRSSALSTFDTAHTTSYSTLIETCIIP